MQDTPVPSFFADLSAQERAHLFTDASLRTLQAAFASIPDPRQRRGQRYDLPFLLICLVAALLCDCNSLAAVGRWTRDRCRALDARSACDLGAGVRAASSLDADGIALSASAAAPLSGACGAGAGELGAADAPPA